MDFLKLLLSSNALAGLKHFSDTGLKGQLYVGEQAQVLSGENSLNSFSEGGQPLLFFLIEPYFFKLAWKKITLLYCSQKTS